MLNYIERSELGLTSVQSHFNRYLNDIETSILIALVKSVAPKVMVEFGCNLGHTSKILLDNVNSLSTYIGIDVPWDYEPVLDCQIREVPLSAGIYAASDPRFALLIAKQGSYALRPSDLEPCDAVFIDGDHSEQVVRHDSYLARVLVRPGGIIVWHDYNNPGVEVTQVLNQLSDSGWPIQSVIGTWLAFMRM